MTKNVLRSEICEILGVEHPICLAGMGAIPGMPRFGKYYTGTSIELVAAVSNAGGFGVLGAACLPPEQIFEASREIKALTSKPFGIDLMFPVVIDTATQDLINKKKADLPESHKDYYAWIDKMKEKYKLPKAEVPDYAKKVWDPDYVRAQFKAALTAEGVVAICSGVGTSQWAVERIHKAGKLSISLIGNVHHAQRVAKMGTDIIVAQGTEAGGHTGKIGTLALVPQVVDAVSPIPVMAAGGIGDGRGLAAALTLGSKGVWVGTAFLASLESSLTDACKQILIDATERSNVITEMFTGKTARVQENPLIEEWLEAGFESLGMPLQMFLVTELCASMEKSGKAELFFLPSGQIAGMIKNVRPAKEIFDDMVSSAVKILKGAELEGITVSCEEIEAMEDRVERIEEVVLAVENQDESIALFEEVFGFRFEQTWTVPIDNMNVKCAKIGETQFHIVASTSPDPNALIPRFIKERGEGLHHIAFKVRDLDDLIRIIRKKGLKLIPENPRTGSNGIRYIFIHPKSASGLLIELIERNNRSKVDNI